MKPKEEFFKKLKKEEKKKRYIDSNTYKKLRKRQA